MGHLRGASIARMALALALALSPVPIQAAAPVADSTLSLTSPTDGLAYVALGDSYAAGFGIAPTTGKPAAGCGQATTDYPHRVASALGLRLDDETCAGAETVDIESASQEVGTQSVPPQARALGPATRVVTVTIGGNDLGFVNAVRSCLALTPHGPLLTGGHLSCRASFVTKGVDSLANRVSGVVSDRLASTFGAIRADAPNAKVFVVGYPALMPDAAHTPAKGCFAGSLAGSITSLHFTNAFPYTDTDVVYLHAIEVDLDRATRAAALHAGFTYTSVLAGTEAHTPSGSVPWLNGITVHSRNLSFSVAPGALHPNALGEAYLAKSVIPAIQHAFPKPVPSPNATTGPSPRAAEPLPVTWYLSVILIIAVFVGAVILLIRRRSLKRRR